jgi:hypothetical protein
MARPERIEEEDDPRRDLLPVKEQNPNDPRPSVLDRRGPVGVTAAPPAPKSPDANREAVIEAEEARIARETPIGQEVAAQNRPADRPAGESVWNNESEIRDFRGRWSSIQTAFVDEPRQAVREADQLVQSVVKTLADRFTHQREELYRQWDRGDNVSTEDLRIAVQRYRAFFDRLLHL